MSEARVCKIRAWWRGITLSPARREGRWGASGSQGSVGWTKIKTRGARKRRTRCYAESAGPCRDPDSNIVLGIGRSTSLSEPTGLGAISHEIYAAGRDRFVSFFRRKSASPIVCAIACVSLVGKKRYAIARVTGVATPRQERDRTVGDDAGKARRKINRVKRVQRKIREEIRGEWRAASEQSCTCCGDWTRDLVWQSFVRERERRSNRYYEK